MSYNIIDIQNECYVGTKYFGGQERFLLQVKMSQDAQKLIQIPYNKYRKKKWNTTSITIEGIEKQKLV